MENIDEIIKVALYGVGFIGIYSSALTFLDNYINRKNKENFITDSLNIYSKLTNYKIDKALTSLIN